MNWLTDLGIDGTLLKCVQFFSLTRLVESKPLKKKRVDIVKSYCIYFFQVIKKFSEFFDLTYSRIVQKLNLLLKHGFIIKY